MKLLTKSWRSIDIPLNVNISQVARKYYALSYIVKIEKAAAVYLYPEHLIIDIGTEHAYYKQEYSISSIHSKILKKYLDGEVIPSKVIISVKQRLERRIA